MSAHLRTPHALMEGRRWTADPDPAGCAALLDAVTDYRRSVAALRRFIIVAAADDPHGPGVVLDEATADRIAVAVLEAVATS